MQIYVDDIIFSVINKSLCKDFAKYMQDEFNMSIIGEFNLFIGLQIKLTNDKIFINQSKRIKYLLKRFGLEYVKEVDTPI